MKCHPEKLSAHQRPIKNITMAKRDVQKKQKPQHGRRKSLSIQRKTTYFVDVETNIGRQNINAGYPAEAVSIGIAKINDLDKEEGVYYKEFRPRVWVDAEALGIHGLSTEYLSQMQPFTRQDANQINSILRDCHDCWAHNAPFDKEVLDRAFDIVGKVFFPFRNLGCTQAVARQHELPQKLDDLYRHFFGCDREQPHRADDDAIDLVHVYKAMKSRGLLSSRSRYKRR